jgi:hypothetical protein
MRRALDRRRDRGTPWPAAFRAWMRLAAARGREAQGSRLQYIPRNVSRSDRPAPEWDGGRDRRSRLQREQDQPQGETAPLDKLGERDDTPLA